MKKILVLLCFIMLISVYSCYREEIKEDVPEELVYLDTERVCTDFLEEYRLCKLRDDESENSYYKGHFSNSHTPPTTSTFKGKNRITITLPDYYTFERKKAEEDAAKGNVEAQYCLFKHSLFGDDIDLLEKNAISGNVKAQYFMFGIYYSGEGLFSSDVKKARYWLEKSAENRNKEAQYLLAVMYKNGYKKLSLLKNPLKFIYWLKESGEQGYYYSQYNLAIMYFWGIGVAEDKKQSFYWFRKLAEQGKELIKNNKYRQGVEFAQNELIYMYDKGIGTKRDKEQALYWLRRSAEEGNQKAQCKLGLRYYRGNGIEKDRKQGAYWIKKSYEKGYEEAKKIWDELELWQYE